MPNKGIDKTAPNAPQRLAPTTKEIRTKAGGKPTNFFIKIGDKILFSICWIKPKAINTKIALNISVGKTIRKRITAVKSGPT